jgi:dCTP deaminase
MVLTGLEILNQIKLGSIFISDFDIKRLNPNSYNLRLHNELRVYKLIDNLRQFNYSEKKSNPLQITACYSFLDMKQKAETFPVEIPEDGLILQPGVLYLGRTVEMTKTHGFVPQIEGRSSIARLGIDIHKTAGWGDDGFENFWTLEIVATHPVKIYPFIEVCQIIYMKTLGDASMKYHGKYQNTGAIDGSKLYEEFQTKT